MVLCRVGRPVRIRLDRDEDMIYSGTRHPYRGDYKVGYTAEGKLTSLEMMLYANGGNSLDFSVEVCSFIRFVLFLIEILSHIAYVPHTDTCTDISIHSPKMCL